MTESTHVNSPDHSLHVAPGSAVASATFRGEQVRGWVANVLLAVSVVVNLTLGFALYTTYKNKTTQAWLTAYDLNRFKSGPFADLKAQVLLNQKLITAFGPSHCGGR